MPGISLDYLCRERSQTIGLEALSGSVLGIEVDHYLRRLVQQSKTPLYSPWAGVAQTLFKTVVQDITTLRRLDIQPFFVFTGLQVVSQHNVDPNIRLTARMHALNALEKKRNDDTMMSFSSLTSPADLTTALKQHFQLTGVEFLVAPYFAGAQLSYMLSIGTLDAIYAPADTLLFGADKVITDMNFTQHARLTFCDKSVVLDLQLQGLNDDQFLDAYLFAGNEFCSIVPILEPKPPSEFSAYRMRAAADVVRQNGTGYLALNGNPALDKRPNYIEDWLKARALFLHHPYINKDGDVMLLRHEQAPNDVARVIGARLPREVYFYLSRGLIDPSILNSLLSGVWRETIPIDGGETREYRYLLDSLNEIRVQCLDLLHGSKQLHHYYEKKVVAAARWYQDNHSEEIEKLEVPVYNELRSWKVDSQYISKFCGGRRDVKSLLEALQNPEAVQSSLAPSKTSILTIEDLETNSLLRTLQLRGYITQAHTLTNWGTALFRGLQNAGNDIEMTIVIAVEMLKMRAIKAEDFSTRFMQETPEKEPADAQWKILGRLGALLPLHQNDAPWQGPLDHDALIAYSLAQTTQRYLIGLFECVQLSSLLRGDVKRERNMIHQITKIKNPFKMTYDAGLATYTKRYLALLAESADKSTNEELFKQLKTTFPTSQDGAKDIDDVLNLWDALYRTVQAAAEQKQMGAIEQRKFERANSWLSSRR